MELLVSKRAGNETGLDFFFQRFADTLPLSNSVSIATGFVSRGALAYLTGVVRRNPGTFESLNLWIGMAKRGGLGEAQRGAAQVLDEELHAAGIGSVHIVDKWAFHGKVYLFGDDEAPMAGMVGSSNFSAIMEDHDLVEVDVYFEDETLLMSIERFLADTLEPASVTLKEYGAQLDAGTVVPFHPGTSDFYADIVGERLDILRGVRSVPNTELEDAKEHLDPSRTFVHTLKVTDRHQGSNLNVYHGPGRLVRKRDGSEFVRPRPWYEVELILSKAEREGPNAPPDQFWVVTDDGWSFEMKRQGDYKKNLRSLVDLRPLGRWLKGRLEDAGTLRPGDLVTDETLTDYGRSDISLTPIEDGSGRWYLDFSADGSDHDA